jgi:hypothetical protein
MDDRFDQVAEELDEEHVAHDTSDNPWDDFTDGEGPERL